MEQKPEQQEQDLQEYIDHMSHFNAKVSLDGTLLLVNKIAEQVSGLSHEELMKTNFLLGQWWTFDSEVQMRVRNAFQKAVNGDTVSYEEKLLAFGKDVIWINLSLVPVFNAGGKVSFIIAEGLNITDRKCVEEQLALHAKELETEVLQRTAEIKLQLQRAEEENEHSKILLESIGDAIIVTDKDGKVMTVNNSAEEMFGWDKKNIIGKIIAETMPLEDEFGKIISKEDHPTFQSARSLKKVTGAYVFTQKDDGKLLIIITSTPIIFQGNLTGTIEVFHDVTKEKEVEQAKSEFISLASHQLRTPVSSIRWHAEGLLAEELGPINEKQRRYVEKIHNANQRTIKIIDLFLNISRAEIGSLELSLENINFSTICEEALGDLSRPIAEKNLTVKTQMEEGLPLIKTDRGSLLIIFENMLSNAVKYTPRDGIIEVDVSRVGEKALIKVSDTGYGIPKKDQPYVFTKLFRASNIIEKETDGNGLGLYLTKSVVGLLGGSIWFESEEDKGTTFFFTIPFAK